MAQTTRIPPMVSQRDALMAVPCNPRQLIVSTLVTCHARHVLVTSLKRSTCPSYPVPKLCAHGRTIHFGLAAVHVTKDGQVILSGTKDPTRILCMVPLYDTMKDQPHRPHIVLPTTASNAYDLTKTTQQVVFLHASTGYPTRTIQLRLPSRANCHRFPQY